MWKNKFERILKISKKVTAIFSNVYGPQKWSLGLYTNFGRRVQKWARFFTFHFRGRNVDFGPLFIYKMDFCPQKIIFPKFESGFRLFVMYSVLFWHFWIRIWTRKKTGKHPCFLAPKWARKSPPKFPKRRKRWCKNISCVGTHEKILDACFIEFRFYGPRICGIFRITFQPVSDILPGSFSSLLVTPST